MSRELKFRAWSNKWDKMVYPDDREIKLDIDNGGGIHTLWLESSDEEGVEVMQFTGLLDKNGKEIYEGDILQCTDSAGAKIIFTCEWGIHRRVMESKIEVDIPGFSFIKSDGRHTFPIVKNYAGKHDMEIIEVIGNLYEHPDLLKETIFFK